MFMAEAEQALQVKAPLCPAKRQHLGCVSGQLPTPPLLTPGLA